MRRSLIDQLLENTDILSLQDSMLSKQNFGRLNYLHCEFYGAGVSKHDLRKEAWLSFGARNMSSQTWSGVFLRTRPFSF